MAPRFRFQIDAEDGGDVPIRLKVEINTRETQAFDGPASLPLKVENPWFAGEAAISTFSREEMLAAKLRALLQRDQGRDLYDLAHALEVFGNLDIARMVEMSGWYFDLSGQTISRAQAQERMFAKLANRHFLLDVRPLLPATQAEALTEEAVAESFRRVFTVLIDQLPGEPWERTRAMKKRFGISW